MNKPILAYLSYPYSGNPKSNQLNGRKLAIEIMKKYPYIFIILPHTAVDTTLFGEFEERSRNHTTEDHELAERLEYIILSKIDLFIIGTEYKDMSTGMTWEHSYCKWLNQIRKRQIEIKFAKELLK